MQEGLENELNQLRDGIDSIDDQILQLLSRRAVLAKRVGEVKQSSGWSYHIPERERSVIERLRERAAKTEFPEWAVSSVFKEIMSACLRLESPIIVSYLGPGSTFSYLALREIFGACAQEMPERTIDDVFDAVESDRADFGVVPIENSFEGTVHDSMHRLIKTSAFVHGEYYLSIEHSLVSAAADFSAVKQVFSHPQAFLQCKGWLRAHLPDAELVASNSTAQACADVVDKPHLAAIASASAAAEAGLGVIARNIQDKDNNQTRFLVLSRERKLSARKTDKCSLIFSVPHLSGKLYRVLESFASANVNILKLEAVPDRSTPWKAHFWMDAQAEELLDLEGQNRVFETAKRHCEVFRHIGTYPKLL